MSKKGKGFRKTFWFKDRARFDLYSKICKELGFSLSERIWELVLEDLERIIEVTKIIKKQKVKKDGK